MKFVVGVVLATVAITVGPVAASAQAEFAPPLGKLGQPPPPPGTLYNHNGVGRLAVGVSNLGASNAYVPAVSWSARTKAGAAVTGAKCGIEVTFPGKRWPMYKSKSCQGSASFPRHVYTVPGRYAITVVDRISGTFATEAFDVLENLEK